MPKVKVFSVQQTMAEFESQNFTQVGGIYDAEIRPQDYLVPGDISECMLGDELERANGEREPRFFRVR
jgi:hypothetical protein